MRALVVYESMFGCTRDVARAVGEGLAGSMPVDVVEVGAAPRTVDPGVDLVVVGGPTHAFSMSRARTRADALGRPGHLEVPVDVGVREWLDALAVARRGIPAAAFDTRVDTPRVPGSAARAVSRRLRGLGFDVVVPPESFWVSGTAGPLRPQELARATIWGADLGRAVAPLGSGGGPRVRG